MQKRILIIEDEAPIRDMVAFALRRAEMLPVCAADAGEAQLAIAEAVPDLILLDWMLPGISGMDLARRLRREELTRDLPIIMLTARGEESDRIRGLDTGADDYVVKPFDLDELLARIRAQIRRREQRTSDALAAHGVSVDLAARTVANAGGPVAVTAKEFKVLAALMRRMGQFVSKEELEGALYDDTADVESNTIEVAVYGLRRKLGPGLIVTARGLGYTIPKEA